MREIIGREMEMASPKPQYPRTMVGAEPSPNPELGYFSTNTGFAIWTLAATTIGFWVGRTWGK